MNNVEPSNLLEKTTKEDDKNFNSHESAKAYKNHPLLGTDNKPIDGDVYLLEGMALLKKMMADDTAE